MNTPIENPYNFITDEMLIVMSEKIDMFWQTGHIGVFDGVDGVRIRYQLFKANNEKGAIVISSGRTESFIKYKEIIYDLSKILNYTVYIHDHRGQGFSGRMLKNQHKGYVKNFNDYVQDLKLFYDTVISINSHKNIYLLAHSMGAGIATLYIEMFPDDFNAAAFTSPMHEPNIGIVGKLFCKIAMINNLLPSLLNFCSSYIPLQGDYIKKQFKENDPGVMTHSSYRYNNLQKMYDEIDANIHFLDSESKTIKLGGITWNWLVEANKASKKMIRNAKQITIPVLVIQAGRDIAVTARGQNEFCKRIRPEIKFDCNNNPFLIRDSYHEILIETDKYRLTALNKIVAFYNKYSSV